MKKAPALFLQAAVVLIGLGTLTLLLWEPHLEGRNAHATVFEIYFNDPFLAFVYAGSIPFFVALCRAFGLLTQVRKTGSFSQHTVDALQTIKRCGFTLLGFVGVGVVIILIFGDKEDRPPGIFMSFLAALGSTVIAITAAMIARRLQHSLDHFRGTRAGP